MPHARAIVLSGIPYRGGGGGGFVGCNGFAGGWFEGILQGYERVEWQFYLALALLSIGLAIRRLGSPEAFGGVL